jgi:peptidoglycan hydrolase CwlO-like protein
VRTNSLLPTVRSVRLRANVAVASALCVCLALIASATPASASAASDTTQITQLDRQIASQGEHIKSLVTRYNDAQNQLDALNAQIAGDQRQLVKDEAAEWNATLTLRHIAVRAYLTAGGSSAPSLALFSDSSSTTDLIEQTRYLGALNSKWDDALTALQLDHARTRDMQTNLRSEQGHAKDTVQKLASARDAEETAIASENTTLSHVRGDLRWQLAAAAEQRRAAQITEEHALAAVHPVPPTAPPVSSPAAPPVAPPVPPLPPTPTGPPARGYADPLRGVGALTTERIDQGVDYSGFGDIYAIGNGVVLSTAGPGWPGGTFIAYRLTDGPAAGLVVYAAEDIAPSVQVGASVTSNTVLGQVYAGPDGIETGWADGAALPNTMARDSGQFNGSNSTAYGYNFSRLLQSLGAPGGVLQNDPPTGSLPATWPRW